MAIQGLVGASPLPRKTNQKKKKRKKANQSLVGASPLPTRHTFHRSPPSHLHTEQNHLHPHPRLDPRISIRIIIIFPSSHLIFFQSYFYLCLSSRLPFSSFKESFHHVEILLFPDTNHVKRKKKMSKNIFDIFHTFHILIIFFPYTNTLKKKIRIHFGNLLYFAFLQFHLLDNCYLCPP